MLFRSHVPDKVLSLFEPHTETIRKGKIATPNEFGKLVTIQESEHQIITAYEVHATRPADVTLWTPALDRHQTIFGRAPDLAAGDRGFSSATNEQAAIDRGVRRVVLPRRGPKSPARQAYTPTLVPSRATVARRLGRPHQRPETTTWTRPLSLSWPRRREPLDRPRRHRE